MIKLSDIPFSLDAHHLMEQLRIRPDTGNAAEFGSLLDRIVGVAQPKALYEVSYVEDRGDESVVLNGVRFTSRALKRNLAQVERVFPYIATCGAEADAVTPHEGDLVQTYWLWTIKEALLDAATAHLYEHLAARYRVTHRATMNPGSGDADLWPLEQQKELFSIFGDVEDLIGVRLTESMLMVPSMSVSGIIYATETAFASCQVCHREPCPRRSAPFDEALWRAVCED